MATTWELRDCDRELFDRELATFIPDRIFDAHAHLYAKSQLSDEAPEAWMAGPERITLEEYRRQMAWIVPDRVLDGLFIPVPYAIEPMVANQFCADEVMADENCYSEMLVTPDMDPDFLRQEVRRLGVRGLKCYHTYAATKPTWSANIEAYLPKALVQVAHEEGLVITLHIVKDRALADPANQVTIRRYCEQYPNIRMILAHAARGFNPHHTIEGIGSLKGLSNVWFDTAAVTEVGAIEAIIETMGHERVLYGSDFPVSHQRGRCVAIGDDFLWLNENSLDWERVVARKSLAPVLVGLESLRILKMAAMHLHLKDSEIEDIFCSNARRLLET